jgi:transposase
MTAGLDLGDKYSYLCLIDAQSGEVIEEARLRTDREVLKRRFGGCEPTRIAIETGTHSPWMSRLLEECGHEVLVANARKVRLIYGGKRKTDKLDAEHLGDASPGWTPSCSLRSSTETKPLRRTWHSYAHARRSSALARS